VPTAAGEPFRTLGFGGTSEAQRRNDGPLGDPRFGDRSQGSSRADATDPPGHDGGLEFDVVDRNQLGPSVLGRAVRSESVEEVCDPCHGKNGTERVLRAVVGCVHAR